MLMLALTSGCATSTILGRPPEKNLAGINTGASRGMVLAELGAPAYTKEINGEKQDIFSFDKGVNGGEKFIRGLLHLVADFLTVFLWEIIAWPAERIAAGPNTKIEITYDKSENVKTVNYQPGSYSSGNLSCESIRATSTEKQYDAFCRLSREFVGSCMESMTSGQRAALNGHVLATKGEASYSSFTFTISTKLEKAEKDFLYWYVSNFTNLKPI